MNCSRLFLPLASVLCGLLMSEDAYAQLIQQGTKLIGSGTAGSVYEGTSVALSADGNTAVVGGFADCGGTGATWVYSRGGGTWSQQGEKLVGVGAVGFSNQGYAVALSADGNTAVVGGIYDNKSTGAAWVFTRTADVWSQQGDKLVGTGASLSFPRQGYSVGLSADGNTAIVGSDGDGAWVFTRSSGIWSQQGERLVGTGEWGSADQGCSVSLSADGNTALVGGQRDSNNTGAAWVFVRSNNVWTQEGGKLVGTDGVGSAHQGCSVSLSVDGNTAVVGGYSDNGSKGAAWVYARSGGMWTQQGTKLVGTGAVGNACQGWSVRISADGSTVIIGGYADNSSKGAAWVFVRSGGVWSQEGSKLVGTGGLGSAGQGRSVSLSANGNTAIVGSSGSGAWIHARSGDTWSQEGDRLAGAGAVANANQGTSVSICADGNTALLGGPYDNNGAGAAWVFTRSSGVWSQEGAKLVGTGAVGSCYQGTSVSLSADGNTAIVGGNGDNGNRGAAWVFTRSEGVWTQQGGKLVGTGAVGSAYQGSSVSLSADGNTAIVGGNGDNSNIGAAWVFTRSGGVWTQQGNKLVGSGVLPGSSRRGSVAVSADGNIVILGGAGCLFVRSGDLWTQKGNKLAVGGSSVSLSADGSTAVVGEPYDNSQIGATWVFTRSDTMWAQQGSKLLATDAAGSQVFQGISVSISADGNMLLVGGEGDDRRTGAGWLFERNGAVWSQMGNKLVGSDRVGDGYIYQGCSVSMSADGYTALLGAYNDNGGVGAAWVFIRIPTGVRTHAETPRQFHLEQNYPNPFNPSTTIRYELPQASDVILTVFDMLGKEVATLVNESKPAGVYTVELGASHLATGVYLYRLQAGSFVSTKKLLLLK